MNMTAADCYALIGNPVAHSRSPFIHTRFAEQTGQAVDYRRILSPLDGFANVLRDFAASGGRGCNITVPFKFEAVPLVRHMTQRAALAQAINVLRFDPEPEGWLGDNSDGIGLVRDIEHNAQRPLTGCNVLLIGAGGAAAGALGPLIEARPACVVVANRTVDRAQRLIDRHRSLAAASGTVLKAAPLADCGSGFDVIINATATSLHGAEVPVSARVLAPSALALDMMYGPAAAPFLQWARDHGAVPRDGLGMLVEQAAEAFALWRGVRPQTAPVLAALREEITATA